MFCKRRQMKNTVRRQVLIKCKVCGEEEYVPLYNDNKCKNIMRKHRLVKSVEELLLANQYIE